MICVSIGKTPVVGIEKIIEGFHLAEIRMDLMEISIDDVHNIFSRYKNLIATYRPGTVHEDERKRFLTEAIESGAAYVDLEVESDDRFKGDIIAKARSMGCKVIISFHDYDKTPEREELIRIVSRCFSSGADLAKISCKVNTKKDCARLLGLLDSDKDIIVAGMGEKGKMVRILAPLLGSPFTYASPQEGQETAEGQLDATTVKRYFNLLKEEMGFIG